MHVPTNQQIEDGLARFFTPAGVVVTTHNDGTRTYTLRLSERETQDLVAHLTDYTNKTTGAVDSARIANVRGIACQLEDALIAGNIDAGGQ